jgi:phosphomannomutase/phosphoglucomutase
MAWTPHFGTSGIRGVVPQELKPEIAWQLGLSIATVFDRKPLLLCHDNRTSGPLLAHALASGLMAGGSDVLSGGQVITPAVSFYTRRRGLAGAVIATGSHIPAEMSGVEVLTSDGAPIDRAREREIEARVATLPEPVPWNRAGSLNTVTDVGPLWVKGVVEQVDTAKIRKHAFRVTVDTGNGSAIPWLLDVMAALDCTVVGVNTRPDPLFPGRTPNLAVGILDNTARIVKQTGSDLGVAVDGDGDRAFFFDDRGRSLMGDVSGTILARIELERRGGGTIVAPINTSNVIEDVAAQFKGKVEYCRIGPPAIVAAVKRSRAIFAFEESGKVIYPETNYLSDSGLAAAHILEHLAEHEVKFSALVDELPKYYQEKRAIECPDLLKNPVLNYALKQAKDSFSNVDIVTIDGVKIVFEDGWLLLRPSGTEPVFRCFSEARSEPRARALLRQGLDWIAQAMKKQGVKPCKVN